MLKTIAFTVNGRAAEVVQPHEDTPLLDVLRNKLRLVGTRFGCGLEQCGCLHRVDRRQAGEVLRPPRRKRRRLQRDDDRRSWNAGQATSAAASLSRRASGPMRILS